MLSGNLWSFIHHISDEVNTWLLGNLFLLTMEFYLYLSSIWFISTNKLWILNTRLNNEVVGCLCKQVLYTSVYLFIPLCQDWIYSSGVVVTCNEVCHKSGQNDLCFVKITEGILPPFLLRQKTSDLKKLVGFEGWFWCVCFFHWFIQLSYLDIIYVWVCDSC